MSIKLKTTTGFVDAERFAKGIVTIVSEPMKRIADRVKALEEREKHFGFKGVWQASNDYLRGNFVTYDGSLWHCNSDNTRSKPGSGSDWTLAVKSGRDK
jgi:hypothetical protein